MRYTVIWVPSAQAQLADLWVQAPDRQPVTDAVDRIDKALRDDPETKAMPWGRFYTFIEDPLVVLLEIDPGDRVVRVIQVRRSVP
jgi:hypothetical protein